MKVDLARQVKIAKPRLRKVEMPISNVTRAERADLARLYLAVLRVWVAGAKEELLAEYQTSLDELVTDSPSSLRAKIEAISARAISATLIFERGFERWATMFSIRHLRKIISSLKYKTNVDLSTQLGPRDTAQTLAEVLQRNLALVRNVSDDTRGRMSDILFRNLQKRTPVREVAKEIDAALKLGRDRSLRIAVDQSEKLAAALDQDRQQQLGMDSFEWVHSQKKHPRIEHQARNGNIYAWNSEIGRDDPPGYKPFCGCKAKGVLNLD